MATKHNETKHITRNEFYSDLFHLVYMAVRQFLILIIYV